jgi:Predicted DNA-binding protein containing a Zn-ribbon domain
MKAANSKRIAVSFTLFFVFSFFVFSILFFFFPSADKNLKIICRSLTKVMLIGIDDTDSNEGMCTTYLAAFLADKLKVYGTVVGFPYLIRLNPSIPYKTRGNAALGIELNLRSGDISVRNDVIKTVTDTIEEYAELSCEKTNPGAVFVFEEAYEEMCRPLNDFFKKAVTDVIEIDEAVFLLEKYQKKSDSSVSYFSLKNGRGLIGALAVCGAMLNSDWEATYEYLAYRKPENWGSNGGPDRFVDTGSLIEADCQTFPETWDTIDSSKKSKPFPVCVPGANDPVLFGIRGNSPEAVLKAASLVVSEEIERFCVFKTNQGTDAHLIRIQSVDEMLPLRSYILDCAVHSKSETISGGHDLFSVRDSAGNILKCAAYEPTGDFRKIIRQLLPGDEITIFGSFKNETLNLEKIKINQLVSKLRFENPICPSCQSKMESSGENQGFRCRKCKTKADKKIEIEIQRKLRLGYYEVPPSARRHLSKPLIRYSKDEL